MKVKQVFRGVPKGKFHPVTYKPGDTVPPELVSAAKAVGADQEAPERPASKPIDPQSVSQMGTNGVVGRSGKAKADAKGADAGKGAAKSGADGKDPEAGEVTEGAEGAEGAEGTKGADGAEGADGADAGAASEAKDGAAAPATSGEPNLGGLG